MVAESHMSSTIHCVISVICYVCLLAKYFMNHRMDFNEISSNYRIHIHVFKFFDHSNSKWPPQIINKTNTNYAIIQPILKLS